MKLTFLGATHEVTGSCYYLEACGKKILIDCGMEQGPDCFVNQPIPVTPSQIDLMLLTHAHIDHSGKIPLLVKEGFSGQIFSTEGTRELCQIMLMDSAHIQESEAEWKSRKAERAGKQPVEPMYGIQDAQDALKLFVGVPYRTKKQIAEGIEVCFLDAGHLLGSASIELWLTEEGIQKKLVFSGDIGNSDQPILLDPTPPASADYVVMESTYGDRSHEKRADYRPELAKVIQRTFDRGGNVVIPSFAVGRTQEMLYFIREIKEKGMVTGHDGFEVYVDSPLAVEATTVFQKRMYFDFDEEASALIAEGINPIGFDGLKLSITSDESKQINFDTKRKVILSASGMCEAGRIRHHLKHNLWRPESTILFVGYQAEGTLGRLLLEGAEQIKIFGEEISVKAEITSLPGISGHADREGLLRWIGAVKEGRPARVFVTHGEDGVCDSFARLLESQLELTACAPYSGAVFDLASGSFLYEAAGEPILKEKPDAKRREDTQAEGQSAVPVDRAKEERGKQQSKESAAGESERKKREAKEQGTQKKETREQTAKDYTAQNRRSPAYRALLKASGRLLRVIEESVGGANRDLERFAGELDALSDRWDKRNL